MNYAEVIDFVKEQTAVNGRPPNYPFRSRFEHTMRVYRWAIKLQSKLGGDLDSIISSQKMGSWFIKRLKSTGKSFLSQSMF